MNYNNKDTEVKTTLTAAPERGKQKQTEKERKRHKGRLRENQIPEARRSSRAQLKPRKQEKLSRHSPVWSRL